MAKVDKSDVDCDFLSLARLVSQSMYFSDRNRPFYQLYGWYMDGRPTIAIGEFEKRERVSILCATPASASAARVKATQVL
jgi:hypothetical protein